MTNDDSRMVKDPICGKMVDTLRARAVGIFGGATFYFCSPECKAKFKDPRGTVGGEPTTPDRRKPAASPSTSGEQPALAGDALPVRYARSRMRRITGEVSTPVVNIDLSASKSKPLDGEPLEPPARGSRGWMLLAVVMLIIAGAVILFTLKNR